MPRLVLKLILPLALAFLALTLAARALGGTRPPNPALRGFGEGCANNPQPCWYGIVPGVTIVAETQRTLLDLGYSPSQRSSYGIITYGRRDEVIDCHLQARYIESTAPIIVLHFQECHGLQFGDIVNVLAFPDTLLMSPDTHTVRYQDSVEITLGGESLSPYRDISSFELRPNIPLQSALGVPWCGFLLKSRYCKSAPGILICA